MSLLVRAAMLGGLVYAVSRVLKSNRDWGNSKYLPRGDAPRLPRTVKREETWPDSEFTSTTNF